MRRLLTLPGGISLGRGRSQASLEDREAERFEAYQRLYRAWPSDGWDGAAAVIAAHHRRVIEVQEELKALHQELGWHRAEGEHPTNGALCVCGLRRDELPNR